MKLSVKLFLTSLTMDLNDDEHDCVEISRLAYLDSERVAVENETGLTQRVMILRIG